jgi:hypothetical protein
MYELHYDNIAPTLLSLVNNREKTG